jgi:hypothetical protein
MPDGEEKTYFFEQSKGKNYYHDTVGGIAEPTPQNMTPKEMMERMAANGAKVSIMSVNERKKIEAEYRKDRQQTNDFLNRAYLTDKTFVKGSRADRTARRAAKRSR